jgi:propionyl-CoA carboxylase beta chain
VGGRAPSSTPDGRQRLRALLDPGSLVERYAVQGPRDAGDGERRTDDGVVAGAGTIGGRDVAVHALGPLPGGGSIGEAGAAKISWIQELALRDRIPVIGLADWRGCGRPGDVGALARWADVLRLHARSSGLVPQIAVVSGPCGGASHAAALSDLVIALDAAGEDLRRGLADLGAADEAEAASLLRRLLSHLPSSGDETAPRGPGAEDPEAGRPALQELAGGRFDVREVAAQLLDGGDLLEVQRAFAPGIVVGFGRLDGHAIGLVANQGLVEAGAIEADAAAKAARFVRLCDAFNLPLLSLVDTAGTGESTAGSRQEAQLVHAYASATVPRLTVAIGAASGAGYLLMSPRQLGADLYLAWPTAAVGAPTPLPAAERGFVDAVIEPARTRAELIRGLRLRRRA